MTALVGCSKEEDATDTAGKVFMSSVGRNMEELLR